MLVGYMYKITSEMLVQSVFLKTRNYIYTCYEFMEVSVASSFQEYRYETEFFIWKQIRGFKERHFPGNREFTESKRCLRREGREGSSTIADDIPVFCSWAGEPNAPSGEPPYPRAAKPAASPEPCCCACCTATAWACATTAAALHAARPAPKARNPHALS